MIINKESNISGIILTGGHSKRMGQDKAFMKLNDEYFIDIAISLLTEFCDEILISSNTNAYSSFEYRSVADRFPDIGPIGGVYSCLLESVNDHNVIIPVDTPFIKKEVYEHILFWKSEYKHIVALNQDSLQEPLHAYYHRDLAGILKRNILQGSFKIQDLSKNISTKFVQFDKSMDFFTDKLFFNANNESDVERMNDFNV